FPSKVDCFLEFDERLGVLVVLGKLDEIKLAHNLFRCTLAGIGVVHQLLFFPFGKGFYVELAFVLLIDVELIEVVKHQKLLFRVLENLAEDVLSFAHGSYLVLALFIKRSNSALSMRNSLPSL